MGAGSGFRNAKVSSGVNTMSVDLSSIHFHDTKIFKVIEDTENDLLTMEVNYPVDWNNNEFEKRRLVFENILNYQVNEIAFSGSPTILDARILQEEERRTRIRLETNAGHRDLSCSAINLTK
jgi:hypothetical protein